MIQKQQSLQLASISESASPGQNPHTPITNNLKQTHPASGSQTNASDENTRIVVDLINKLDDRLQVIEQSVTKLNIIQTQLSKVICDVDIFKNDNVSMKRQMSDVDKFCQNISGITDEFRDHKINSSSSICALQYDNRSMFENIEKLQSSNDQLHDTFLDLQ